MFQVTLYVVVINVLLFCEDKTIENDPIKSKQI